jgi:UDP-N-acetylmuramoylalanine--D-glutamate ligase
VAETRVRLTPEDFAGVGVMVAGLGRSGRAACRALSLFGAELVAVDDNARIDVGELRALGIEVILGPGGIERLEDVRLVVVGPGLPERHPVVRAALDAGLPVWSEVELAARMTDVPMVGVTGTNGKTTTTELATAMLNASGLKAVAAGNVGLPLIEAVQTWPAPDAFVVELSSFQLRFTDLMHLAAGAWLNLAPDHLDWHQTMADYAAAKARIWANSTPDDWVVFPAADPEVAEWAERTNGLQVPFTLRQPAEGEIGIEAGIALSRVGGEHVPLWRAAALRLPGKHNLTNALAASGLALSLGANPAGMARAVAAFRASPHRLAEVGTVRGVTFVDDSKATNPHAAARSLGAYRRVVWIAGGRNKGLAFDELVEQARDRIAAAVLIGEAAEELAFALGKAGFEGQVVQAGTMDEAVTAAFGLAQRGDTVLLAPACASQDMFVDYKERGDSFAAAVARLGGLPAPDTRSGGDQRARP